MWYSLATVQHTFFFSPSASGLLRAMSPMRLVRYKSRQALISFRAARQAPSHAHRQDKHANRLTPNHSISYPKQHHFSFFEPIHNAAKCTTSWEETVLLRLTGLRMIHLELLPEGARVHTCSPGYINKYTHRGCLFVPLRGFPWYRSPLSPPIAPAAFSRMRSLQLKIECDYLITTHYSRGAHTLITYFTQNQHCCTNI